MTAQDGAAGGILGNKSDRTSMSPGDALKAMSEMAMLRHQLSAWVYELSGRALQLARVKTLALSFVRLRLDHPDDAVAVIAAIHRGSVEGAVGVDGHITLRKCAVDTSREIVKRGVHPAVFGLA